LNKHSHCNSYSFAGVVFFQLFTDLWTLLVAAKMTANMVRS